MSQKKVCLANYASAMNARVARCKSISSLVLENLVAMERFSEADRASRIREFYKNTDLTTEVHRKFCNIN